MVCLTLKCFIYIYIDTEALSNVLRCYTISASLFKCYTKALSSVIVLHITVSFLSVIQRYYHRSGWRIFFSRVNFLCWLFLWYQFHPCVTTVAHKRTLSFCQKCRWQVTAKHTCILPTWFWMWWHCKLVHVWDGSSFTWHQPCSK